jgi:predicted Zn-dependent protease
MNLLTFDNFPLISQMFSSMNHTKLYLLICMPLLILSACVANPLTGRQQAMVVTDEQAAASSALSYSQLLGDASKNGTLDEVPAQLSRVKAITDVLVKQAIALRPATGAWNWEVHVLKSDEVNAWCMAGGKMAIYTGLLDKLNPTDDEIAAVMGHEISHAVLSHQAEKMSRAQMQQVGVSAGVLAGSLFGVNLSGLTPVANSVADIGLQLPNSREAETEADLLGLRNSAQAGFNPEAAVSLWTKMLQHDGSSIPEWLSTHPDTRVRLARVEKEAQQLRPIYEASVKTPHDAATTP